MSDIASKIRQRNAAELAAGYSRAFRCVEIASIGTFWALLVAIGFKLKESALHWPWLIMAALFSGFLMADFVSGFVHWAADTWGSVEMPLIGKALIRPFREHHIDAKAMTHHDYIETNGANCLISIPVAAMAWLTPIDIEGWQTVLVFGVTSITSMIFWVMMTNQFHKWAHFDEAQLPKVVRLLQRWHMILPIDHHEIHHTAPFENYYCITTGWLNRPLAKLQFFRVAERMVTLVFGLIPRKDDLGLDAALSLAPIARSQVDLPRS